MVDFEDRENVKKLNPTESIIVSLEKKVRSEDEDENYSNNIRLTRRERAVIDSIASEYECSFGKVYATLFVRGLEWDGKQFSAEHKKLRLWANRLTREEAEEQIEYLSYTSAGDLAESQKLIVFDFYLKDASAKFKARYWKSLSDFVRYCVDYGTPSEYVSGMIKEKKKKFRRNVEMRFKKARVVVEELGLLEDED